MFLRPITLSLYIVLQFFTIFWKYEQRTEILRVNNVKICRIRLHFILHLELNSFWQLKEVPQLHYILFMSFRGTSQLPILQHEKYQRKRCNHTHAPGVKDSSRMLCC